MAQTFITVAAKVSVASMWHCSAAAVAGMGCSNSLGEEVL